MDEDFTISDIGDDLPEGADDTTSFLASPVPQSQKARQPNSSTRARSFSRSKPGTVSPLPNELPEDPEAREARLRQELATLKSLNSHLGTVISSLETAQKNLHTVNGTVAQASTLLNTWTRILGQTEHNQRLILNPSWQGATADAAAIAADEERRDIERQRKRDAEERRKADRERKVEEERLKREAEASGIKTVTRGRAAGPGRGQVTGVRGTRGGVRGGSATAGGRGLNRTGSVGTRGRGASATRGARGRAG